MKRFHLHPLSLLVGFGVASLAFLTMSQGTKPAPASVEYKIVDDVTEAELKKLEDWEYVGYLGQGNKGTSNDETLWRKRTR